MSDLHRALSGAHRPNSNPRIHRHSSPYKRPLGQSALHPSSTMGDLASLAGRETSPTKKPVPTSRVQSLASGGSLTRSGSEPSLLSGIKSIFTRPLQWLSTPGKTAGVSKRDSLSSFGNELEDPESPSDRREGKRIRRHSPEPRTNRFNDLASDYAPEHQFEVQGRAVSGFMLPPLSPHVTLKPKSSFSNDKTAHRKPANFSRPLTSSQSMSYLDPPSNVLRSSAYGQAVASPKKTGTLTRSKRVDLATLADDDAGFQEDSLGKDDRGKEKEIWSPWKSKYAGANGASSTAAAQKNITPGRKTFAQTLEDGDHAHPMASPFRGLPTASPRPRQPSTIGLGRSATAANLRRHASVVSDLSMASAGDTVRSTSIRNLRDLEIHSPPGGSISRDKDDDRMSVEGDSIRRKEGSVLDWFMHDQWEKPKSPASVAASNRLGTSMPRAAPTPMRRGQMVWNQDDKVFMRESELKASQRPAPVHKNEAERILYTLEAMRKTPLTDARKGDIPPLLGQSSRTLRRSINVPLATAAGGESAKQRKDKERFGDLGVSVMISPYGRRRVADREAREVRKHSRMESQEYRPSPTPSDARSETASQISGAQIEYLAPKESSPSPSAPTPRRSSRLNRTNAVEETTPKANRRSTRRGAPKQPAPVHEEEPVTRSSRSTRRTKKTVVERSTSPTPPPAPPSVPSIIATAPSPGKPSTSDTYQPRAVDQMPRGGSSLRARSDTSKRTHQSAASYSRSQTPPTSGRYSAKDEDLPDMEELEKASKIALPSFSGISFAGLKPSGDENASNNTMPSKSVTTPAAPLPPLSLPRAGGPLARLGVASTRPRASSPLAAGSIVAAPDSPPTMPVPNKNDSSPLANGIFPISGGTTEKSASLNPTGSTTPAGKPPAASSFFSKAPTSTEAAKKPSFSFGDSSSKVSGETISGAGKAEAGSIPNFFGSATVSSASSTKQSSPVPVPALDFGVQKKDSGEKAPPAALPPPIASASASPAPVFSFGASVNGNKEGDKEKTTDSAASPFSFGGKEPEVAKKDSAAPSGGFSFGVKKDSTSGGEFSFGKSKDSPAAASNAVPSFSFSVSKPAASDTVTKSPFSFGAPASDKPKSDEPSKPAFTFGQSNSSSAAPDSVNSSHTPSKPAFSFGAPAPSSNTPASKPAFTFGASSSTTPVTTPTTAVANKDATGGGITAPSTTPAFGGFSFGSQAVNKAEDKKDAPANPFGGTSNNNSTFTLGGPANKSIAANGTSSPFGTAPSTVANADSAKNPFDNKSGPNGVTAPAFTFGAPGNASMKPANAGAFGSNVSTGSQPFVFGASSVNGGSTSAPLNTFKTDNVAKPSTPAFAFGSGSNATPASNPFNASTAPASNPFGQQQDQKPNAPASFAFGATNNSVAAPASNSSFSFGQPMNASPAASTSTFSFGQPAQQQSSTPAAPSFSFGQTAAQPQPAAAFSFGAPAGDASRFKSPTPGPEGGFSLGVATNEAAPASPGGRRVKGLPRRR
ncbi:nucleoporin nsp1, putative [Cryptococcus deneoformans JEC21]|uniref:Nucleoporin nsp1, putative n=1 Tax=Cryptococcus deneoformans (strain JEC21 / ATCC MYA-565) TaxID=214684 RepID=Q5KNH8_CRYD1|nr:nucleoporin nsp1, putative [Cryptococcus neoformans var. neoformans JEC21]AAW41168.2 nucleoporin nsp1, putative [Cryptococcus neoformans var. neoformans JEC21]